MAQRTTRALWWVLAFGWMAFIFRMSMIPGSDVPGRFGTLAHFVEYAVLGLLMALAFKRLSLRDRILVAASLAAAYAMTDELHQAFVRGRMPDHVDLLVDTAGALTATICLAWFVRSRRSSQ